MKRRIKSSATIVRVVVLTIFACCIYGAMRSGVADPSNVGAHSYTGFLPFCDSVVAKDVVAVHSGTPNLLMTGWLPSGISSVRQIDYFGLTRQEASEGTSAERFNAPKIDVSIFVDSTTSSFFGARSGTLTEVLALDTAIWCNSLRCVMPVRVTDAEVTLSDMAPPVSLLDVLQSDAFRNDWKPVYAEMYNLRAVWLDKNRKPFWWPTDTLYSWVIAEAIPETTLESTGTTNKSIRIEILVIDASSGARLLESSVGAEPEGRYPMIPENVE